MKSKATTTMVAACAASVSSPCAANHFDAVADIALHRLELDYNHNKMIQTSLLDRIPRGGYTPPDSKKKRKTKKKKKGTTTPNQHDTKKKAEPPPPSSSKQQPPETDAEGDTDNSSGNTTDCYDNDPTTPPRFHFHSSGTNPSSAHPKNAHHNDANSSSSPSSSQQHQNQETLPPAVQSILQQTCHYDVLGITRAASQIEIQKAYRRRCKLTHPDKLRGGERTAFDKVSEAYDVLSCEKKRAVYDRYGKEGLEKGISTGTGTSGTDFRFGTTAGTSFFGNDLFREFFGQQQHHHQSTNAFRWAQPQQPPSTPRNRDLRYQLEVTLEELYNGTTKHVAIQQPNPERPYFPYRKELEVSLPRGIQNGQCVRLSGVVDSVSDAPPADVIFLIRERRHPIFTRRGHDLAMEIKISFSEAIVGYRRQITCLDGRTIVIGSPYVRKAVVQRVESVDDVPSLPSEKRMDEDTLVTDPANKMNDDAEDQYPPILAPSKQRATKTTILSYDLPPSILQTGDVHVLKGYGMPKRRGGHHDDQYGDLYIQYVVEMPLGSSSSSSASAASVTSASNVNAANLSPEERVELARLLCKLEGRIDDRTRDIVHSSIVYGDAAATADGIAEGEGGENDPVHFLSVASASDFGNSNTAYDDQNDHDEHLRHDDDDEDDVGGHGTRHHHHQQDISDFFRRAFTAGRSSSPFGFGGTMSGGGGGGGGGGFHYFSSGSRGRGYGRAEEEEEDHKVECNQM